MSAIVIFGGTVEGRQLAEAFQNTDLELHLCVATEYGASLLPIGANIHIHAGRMDALKMETFFAETEPEYCLDATHPYAKEVTRNIVQACQKCGLSYIRVARETGESVNELHAFTRQVCAEDIIYHKSIEDAVTFLNQTTGNIFITTGSRDLEKYTKIKDYKDRCYARVLPIVPVMEKCRELGFEGGNLIGMQGPFGEELNYWMMKQIHASYMVTKDSGKEGGFAEKCEAALRAGVHILVIERGEEEPDGMMTGGQKAVTLKEAVCFLQERYGMAAKREVFLIGMGTGSREQLTGEAEKCLKQCDVVIGAKRMLDLCQEYGKKPSYVCCRKEEIVSFLENHPEYKKAAVVYSGDIGFYSGANGMKELLGDYEVHPVSGVSSVVYFLNWLFVPWHEAELVSCHGREINLLSKIRQNRWVCSLLGDKESLKRICRLLLEFHMEEIKITIGERLSYPEEKIITGTPETLFDTEVDALSVLLLENPNPIEKRVAACIRDDALIRGNVPMTKQEIRTLSLAKLALTESAVMYDIGAGTGSVAVEAALHCEKGRVYAIEKNQEAIRLIQENKHHFGAENLTIIEGTAPECLSALPEPTHVFIGGSGGNLFEIIRMLLRKNKKARYVINAVTLETVAQIEQIRETFPEFRKMEIIQVNVARGRELGRYHLMAAENPVYIISFGGKGENLDEK